MDLESRVNRIAATFGEDYFTKEFSKEDIIANYEVTHTYLKENVKLRLDDGLEELEFSRPEWIENAYDHILEHYGSFKVYLMAAGLTKKEIKKVRKKLEN